MKGISNFTGALCACFVFVFLAPLSGCGSDDDGQSNPLGLAGNYALWHWNSGMSGTGNPLDRLFCSGHWQTIDATHKLVWVDYNVVFETDENGNYHFWRVDMEGCADRATNPFNPEIGHGQDPTLRSTNPIVFLEGDALLAIHDGYQYTTWHLDWAFDEASVTIDTALDSGGSVVYDTDRLVYLGLGNVLVWRPSWSGSYTIFSYNYQPPTSGTQFTRDAVLVQGNWTNRNGSHSLTYMGQDAVLDVDAVGNFQVWHYNRSAVTGMGDPFDHVILSGQWSGINSQDWLVYLPSERFLVVQ